MPEPGLSCQIQLTADGNRMLQLGSALGTMP
ncbi:MAG: hypothetical protein RLZZ336_343 [Cyanobacteriota bacterium]